MSKPKNEYEKLRAVWYKKLESEGFEDIEQDEDNLKVWSSQFRRKKSVDTWQAKAAYYYMAENFLREHTFENNLDRIVWEYHSNAISIRDIVKLLKKVRIVRDHNWVHSVVKRLSAIMKKKYMNHYEETNRE